MKKAKLNLIIDIIMLVVMMALIGVGLLNRYVLLTGQQKWEKYGENLEFYLWGFDRHDWNYIHFILGLILFGLLVFHIWFHWKLILNIYKNLIKTKKTRMFSGFALVFIFLLFVAFPAFVEPEIGNLANKGERPSQEGHGSNDNETIIDTNHVRVHSTQQHEGSNKDIHRDVPSNIDVEGKMTLLEVATKYNVPANHIKSKLNIPLSTSDNERLGRLKKTYRFTMSDVEEIIYKYQKDKQ